MTKQDTIKQIKSPHIAGQGNPTGRKEAQEQGTVHEIFSPILGTPQNKTKQNKTKQNKTKQNKTKQNKLTTTTYKQTWFRPMQPHACCFRLCEHL